VNQDPNRDLRQKFPPCNARSRILSRTNDRQAYENVRHIEYDTEHGPPGLKQFTPNLRQVIWPKNFNLEKLRKYDGKENPENWITLYEITVRSTSGNEHIMANYLPVVLDQAGHQWLLSLPENQFDSWAQLKHAFINNFIATCDQPGNKYDLECICDSKDEPLRDYI
jgi:hypothetical protein